MRRYAVLEADLLRGKIIQRSNLGAVQNWLEFAHSSLMFSIQNTESSLSTIRDADFATEASNLALSQARRCWLKPAKCRRIYCLYSNRI